MDMKLHTPMSSPLMITKKNLLLLAILAVSVSLLAVSVFAAGEWTAWLIAGNASNGGGATPTLNQSYANVQNTNVSFNISMNVTFVNASFVLKYINITSLNSTGFNFNGTGPYQNGSTISQINYGGPGGTTGWTSINLSNASGGILNATPSGGAGLTNNLSFVIGMNFSAEGRYAFTMNLSINNTGSTGGTGQNNANTSNFTILADWTPPSVYLFRSNASGANHNIIALIRVYDYDK